MQSPSADIHMTSDVDTHPSNLQTLAHVSPAHQKVIEYIESTFDHIIHEIQVRPHGKPVITLRRITAINPYYDHSDYMRLKWHIEDRPMTYSFPGKNKEEAWRFGRHLSSMNGRTPQLSDPCLSCSLPGPCARGDLYCH